MPKSINYESQKSIYLKWTNWRSGIDFIVASLSIRYQTAKGQRKNTWKSEMDRTIHYYYSNMLKLSGRAICYGRTDEMTDTNYIKASLLKRQDFISFYPTVSGIIILSLKYIGLF